MVIVPTSYLGNLAYYKTLFENNNYKIEAFEYYSKQSFRSRCEILGANGRLTLSIPILKGSFSKQVVKDVKIEYVMEWQKQHWRSITSAYKSSPYFYEYEDMFAPHYHKKEKYLLDFNQALHSTILDSFSSRINEGILTTAYHSDDQLNIDDEYSLCNELSSKKGVIDYTFSPYYQVFNDKFNFEANLSIIDYLFCEGPSNISSYMKSE